MAALRRDLLFERLAGRGHELEGGGCAVDQCARFVDRLAVVAPLQVREFFAAGADGFGDAEQNDRALVRLALCPVGLDEGVVRALDGLGGVLRTRGMQLGTDTQVGRIQALVGVAFAATPLAADVDRQVAQGQPGFKRVDEAHSETE